MDDQTLAAAIAETMKDPRHFREVLMSAATLASGRVVEFSVDRKCDPITVSSAGFNGHPAKDVTVGWDYDTSIRFVAKVYV